MHASEPIIVVGAGLAGAATAYHLRQQGATQVLVLERAQAPGCEASGHSAAILRERMEAPALAAWSAASAAALRALGVVRRTGGFEIDEGTASTHAHVPGAHGTGTFLPDDGVVDVPALLELFLRDQRVHLNTHVHAYERTDAGLQLTTSGGTLTCKTLVNATGAHAGVFGRLDVHPTKRHVFVSRPDDTIDPSAPYVWDLSANYYFRPETGGWMLCACDEVPCAPDDHAIDPDAEARMRAKMAKHQPQLRALPIARRWAGHRTFTEDRLPVLGWDTRISGLFHVAALGGHGVTLSYEVGRRAAAMLLGRADPEPAFAPARVEPQPSAHPT